MGDGFWLPRQHKKKNVHFRECLRISHGEVTWYKQMLCMKLANGNIGFYWIPKNKQMSLFRFFSSPGEGTMLAAKRSAGVAPKENFREHVTCTPPLSANKAVNFGICILFYYVFSFRNLEISLILCEWKGLSCFCFERFLSNIRTY